MEYTLKAEDIIIGNSAVSEDDNTNQSHHDYGDDCVGGDCDRKSDGADNSDGDTKRDEGVMLQMATVVMLRLLIIMLGLQLMITLMMAMMTVMVIVVTVAALVTRAAHTVEFAIMK